MNGNIARVLGQWMKKTFNLLDSTHGISERVRKTKYYSVITDNIKDYIEEKTHIHLDRSFERKTSDIYIYKLNEFSYQDLLDAELSQKEAQKRIAKKKRKKIIKKVVVILAILLLVKISLMLVNKIHNENINYGNRFIDYKYSESLSNNKTSVNNDYFLNENVDF